MGIVRYAAPHLSDTAEEVVRLNAAIKNASLRFENLPKDLSKVAVRSTKGLELVGIRVLCCDCVVVTLAQLTHHCSPVVKGELRAMHTICTHSTGYVVNSLFLPRRSRCMKETRGSTECSRRCRRWE